MKNNLKHLFHLTGDPIFHIDEIENEIRSVIVSHNLVIKDRRLLNLSNENLFLKRSTDFNQTNYSLSVHSKSYIKTREEKKR